MAFTTNRTLKLEKGLYLLEQKGGRTYAARAWADGKWAYTNLGTGEYKPAVQAALKWFRSLNSTKGGESMADAMTAYLNSIHDPGKRENHLQHWSAIREFWAPGMERGNVLLADTNAPKLMEFVDWKRKRGAGPSTIRKDLVTIRQALKFAVMRGTLEQLPQFPGAHVLGAIKANPQPWLTQAEYRELLDVAKRRITEAPNVRCQHQRIELLAFVQFMHSTGMRVDEARSLRVKDCRLESEGGRPQRGRDGEWVMTDEKFRLEISVRQSKTGPRQTIARRAAVKVFQQVAAGKKPGDMLFNEHHRDAFRELLEAARLRKNGLGFDRNLKCLRPTSLSHWLLEHPQVDLAWLSTNVGTSITMLNDFYLKRLGVHRETMNWLD